jgi:CopG family nickel-responsive transcriptional regulator
MEKVVRSGVSLNSELLKRFDEVIEEKGYVNRSKAIKDLIRNFLISEEWEKGKEVFGSQTILYDHEVRRG